VDSMSIGEVARRAGVRPSALRYYEGVGVLPAPERENGRRHYDEEVLREVLPPSERWRVLAQAKLPEVEALVKRALGMKVLLERGLRCECLRLDDCDLIGGEAQDVPS
jgi:MerR family transcriptional regulator, redox-sensitive transcriptional activator SoxR